jgi:hypothetical protein
MTAGTSLPVCGSVIAMSVTCCLRGSSRTASRSVLGTTGRPTSPLDVVLITVFDVLPRLRVSTR